MQTAVLGTSLARGAGGGFKGRGDWSATKWFLQNGQEEAELFFNFNLVSGQAEFAEKDQDYREELIEQLVAALRDGPAPERTPENDPTLSTNGPTIVNWKQITGSNSWAGFTPDGLRLILQERDEKRVGQFYLAPASRPAERKLLGAITNSPTFNGAILTETGVMALVTETIPTRKGVISSTDPRRLWLIRENEMKVVPMPPAMTNWYLPDAPLSPDGTFIAVQSWRGKPPQTRVIHLYQVRANKWSTLELPGTIYELAGWKTAANGKLTAYVRTGMTPRTNEIRKPFLLDPSNGTLSEINTLPPELEDKRAVSPDGRRTATVREKEKLIITDVGSGQVREFQFHPSDRKSLYAESVSWVSPRYLFFQGSRPAILDADTLTMSFLFARDSGFRSVEFTPDFKLALGEKEEGRFLGEVNWARRDPSPVNVGSLRAQVLSSSSTATSATLTGVAPNHRRRFSNCYLDHRS
jgi:hypothetical protein